MNLCRAFAIRINNLLKANNLTLYRFEQKTGIPHGTLMNILNENNKNITIKTLILIAQGFDMSLLEFLNDPLLIKAYKEVE